MNLVKSMEETLNKMYSTKEEKNGNGEKIKLSKKKEKVDLNPKIEDEMSEAKTHNKEDHDCDEVHPGESHKEWEKENVEKEAKYRSPRDYDDLGVGSIKYYRKKGDKKAKRKEEVEMDEEMSPEDIKAAAGPAMEQYNNEMRKNFPEKQFTSYAVTAPLGGGITFVFAVIPTAKAKGVDLLNAPSHSKYMMHLTNNRGEVVPTSKFSIAQLMGRLPVKFRKITAKSPTDAVKKMTDWFKKNKSEFEGQIKEEVEVDGRKKGYREALARINSRKTKVSEKKKEKKPWYMDDPQEGPVKVKEAVTTGGIEYGEQEWDIGHRLENIAPYLDQNFAEFHEQGLEGPYLWHGETYFFDRKVGSWYSVTAEDFVDDEISKDLSLAYVKDGMYKRQFAS